MRCIQPFRCFAYNGVLLPALPRRAGARCPAGREPPSLDRQCVGGEQVTVLFLVEPIGRRRLAVRSERSYRVYVELRDGEGFEQMLRRFTQQVNRQGLLKEHRRRRFFVSKSEDERERRKRNARRRATRRTPRT